MRLCVFSPEVAPLEKARVHMPLWQAAVDDVVLLTCSWADVPPDSPVRVTAGARRLAMRAARRIIRRRARVLGELAGARLFAPLLYDDIAEALRAADADAVVSLDPAWVTLLRRVVDRGDLRLPCAPASAPAPDPVRRSRQYDPAASVSIVLPTYNGVTYLRQSVESCLGQTHRNLELVVVDDGSSSTVANIVREYPDARIRYVRHERNRGLPEALNTGFRHARGEYRTWTSDDNYYEPDAIERMLSILQTYRGIDFVYADSWAHDEATGGASAALNMRPPESLAQNNWIGPCFLYTRRVTDLIGDYNPRAVLAEDYDYWIRVARRFRMQRLFRRLYHYRFHAGSLTSRFRTDLPAAAQKVRQAYGSPTIPEASS